MSSTDLVTAIGRLLSARHLREAYVQDPYALADKLEVDNDHRADFVMLNIEQLEAQAKTLLSKRFHEVHKLLPKTTCLLVGHAQEYFFDYAEQSWPEGSNRHRLDAEAFIDYLKRIKVNFCQEELNRLRFYSENKAFSVYFLKSIKIRGRLRRSIQVICKLWSRQYEWCLYLG